MKHVKEKRRDLMTGCRDIFKGVCQPPSAILCDHFHHASQRALSSPLLFLGFSPICSEAETMSTALRRVTRVKIFLRDAALTRDF